MELQKNYHLLFNWSIRRDVTGFTATIDDEECAFKIENTTVWYVKCGTADTVL